MNVTGDILCYTCQTSNGFSSAEQRGIIVLIILVIIMLILCYAGVLWFGIRSRFVSDKASNVIVDTSIYNNDAFNNEEEQNDEYVQSVDNARRATTSPEDVRVKIDNEIS